MENVENDSESQGMECQVDEVGMGRQGVMNGCWEDNNRTGWRGKELGDMEMERSDEVMGTRVTE